MKIEEMIEHAKKQGWEFIYLGFHKFLFRSDDSERIVEINDEGFVIN